MPRIQEFLMLLRPHQWYKNFLVFVGAVFALKFMDFSLWPRLLLGFLILCLASGANYIVNDIMDARKDKLHPEKKKRPISSGALPSWQAIAMFALVASLSLYAAWYLGFGFFLMVAALFLTGQLYSFVAKGIPLVDVLTISADYVWRALAGCYLVFVTVSNWLILCVFLLALLLALGKRKAERMLMGSDAEEYRSVFRFYRLDILNQFIIMTATGLLVSYFLYSFMSDTGHGMLVLTIPVAAYIVFRYTYYTLSNDPALANPERLVFDPSTVIALTVWVGLVIFVLYFWHLLPLQR